MLQYANGFKDQYHMDIIFLQSTQLTSGKGPIHPALIVEAGL